MARKAKRDDGLYQKNIVLGRKPDGSYKRKTIYAKTQKELNKKAAELIAQVEYGIYVPEDKTTFSDLADLWIKQIDPKLSENWQESLASMLNIHILPAIGSVKIKDLKPYHLQDIINELNRKGFSTGSMKKIKQTAGRVLEVAYDHDMIPKNVFTKVKVPSIEPNSRRALTEAERDLLTRTWQGHRMGIGAMIMMYCGLRKGEMLALRWEDIDFEKKTLNVDKSVVVIHNHATIKEPKSKAGIRQVPIPNRLLEMLKAAKTDNVLICSSVEGKLMTETAYRRAWECYTNYLNVQAGGRLSNGKQKRIQVIDNITAHMLRHIYATMLYDAGVDVKSAQQFLGHASLDMTLDIYTHLSKFKQNAAIESLNAHLDNI